jgi:hypothetical protein
MRTTARPGRSLEHGASANRNPRKQQGICYATDAIGASSPDHHPGAAPFFPAEDLSLLRKYRQRGGPPHQRRCRPRAVDRTPVRTGPPELCRDRRRQEGSERGDEKASFSTARSRMLKVAPATPTEIWTSAHSIPKSTRSTTCWRLSAAVELRLQSRVLLLARNPGHTEMKELRTSTLASLQGKTLWGRAPSLANAEAASDEATRSAHLVVARHFCSLAEQEISQREAKQLGLTRNQSMT